MNQINLKNSSWTEEELLLALELYLSEISVKKIEALSAFLRLKNYPNGIVSESFRNKNSIKLKLSNFAALDPNYSGKGMTSHSKKDLEIWNTFSSDESLLAQECKRIRAGEAKSESSDDNSKFQKIPLEKNSIVRFKQFRIDQTESTRRESLLLTEYTQYLEAKGKTLCRCRYIDNQFFAVSDLFNETDNLLIEAKGRTDRELIRLAVGQLLDYKRYHLSAPNLGVLLPRRPSENIIIFLKDLNIKVIWKTHLGWSES